MKILVINGPNLNMLGIREPDHYGRETYSDLVAKIERYCKEKDRFHRHAGGSWCEGRHAAGGTGQPHP